MYTQCNVPYEYIHIHTLHEHRTREREKSRDPQGQPCNFTSAVGTETETSSFCRFGEMSRVGRRRRCSILCT